jgi:hypothetical protein
MKFVFPSSPIWSFDEVQHGRPVDAAARLEVPFLRASVQREPDQVKKVHKYTR